MNFQPLFDRDRFPQRAGCPYHGRIADAGYLDRIGDINDRRSCALTTADIFNDAWNCPEKERDRLQLLARAAIDCENWNDDWQCEQW